MITSDAVHPRSPHVHGAILSSSIYQSPTEVPGIGRFLSQGAVAGAFAVLLPVVILMLQIDRKGYNFFFLFFLPLFLFGGMAIGLIEGVVIWVCTLIDGHRLDVAVRAFVACLVLLTLLIIITFLFSGPSSYYPNRTPANYYSAFGGYVAFGIVFGFVIGSGFRPGRELIRGTTANRWPIMTALTGVLLRLIVVFGLMDAILNLIWILQRDFRPNDGAIAVIALGHFTAAAVIVFARMPVRLLQVLALVVNFPVVLLFKDRLEPEEVAARTIIFVYIALWGAFLACRWTMPRRQSLQEWFIE